MAEDQVVMAKALAWLLCSCFAEPDQIILAFTNRVILLLKQLNS